MIDEEKMVDSIIKSIYDKPEKWIVSGLRLFFNKGKSDEIEIYCDTIGTTVYISKPSCYFFKNKVFSKKLMDELNSFRTNKEQSDESKLQKSVIDILDNDIKDERLKN